MAQRSRSLRTKAEAEPEVQHIDPAESTGNWPKGGFRVVAFNQRQAIGYKSIKDQSLGDKASRGLDTSPEVKFLGGGDRQEPEH